jgi:hypothetical protein
MRVGRSQLDGAWASLALMRRDGYPVEGWDLSRAKARRVLDLYCTHGGGGFASDAFLRQLCWGFVILRMVVRRRFVPFM